MKTQQLAYSNGKTNFLGYLATAGASGRRHRVPSLWLGDPRGAGESSRRRYSRSPPICTAAASCTKISPRAAGPPGCTRIAPNGVPSHVRLRCFDRAAAGRRSRIGAIGFVSVARRVWAGAHGAASRHRTFHSVECGLPEDAGACGGCSSVTAGDRWSPRSHRRVHGRDARKSRWQFTYLATPCRLPSPPRGRAPQFATTRARRGARLGGDDPPVQRNVRLTRPKRSTARWSAT